MNEEQYPMTTECCESYRVTPRQDGGIDITIQVCPRFADLWITKLDALLTNELEIAEYAPDSEE